MFKMTKGFDKISAEELFNRMDTDRISGHSFRRKKKRVRMVVRLK